METTENPAAVELSERIDAAPEIVFDFLVDAEKLVRWMGVEADIDPTPGGLFRLDVTGGDIAVGEYLEVDRPNRVVFTWGWEGSADVPPGSSTVAFTLMPDGDGTVVQLSHAGLPGGQSDEHRGGWGYFVPRLAAVAAGRPVDPQDMGGKR